MNIKMFSEEPPVVEETVVGPAALNISLPTQKHGPSEGMKLSQNPFTALSLLGLVAPVE